MKNKQSIIPQFLKKNASFTSIFVALILISIVWSVLTPYYLTLSNFKNICVYVSANGIMAAGLTITLVLGGLDLSQISLMALSGMAAAIGYEHGLRGITLLLVAMLVGIVGGMINGCLITYMGINPFIATLATQLAFRGMAFIVTDGRYISINDTMVRFIGIAIHVLDHDPGISDHWLCYEVYPIWKKYLFRGWKPDCITAFRNSSKKGGIGILHYFRTDSRNCFHIIYSTGKCCIK